jgi:hypothetical protein
VKAKSGSSQGMSLVEVLVALVFVSLAVAMFTYFIDALRMNQNSKQETAATLFAKDYVEGLRSKWRSFEDYQNLALAMPNNIPEGYELEIKIKNETGQVIYAYPGGTAGNDDSLLRSLNLTFSKDHQKTLSFETVVTRPTPVYPLEDTTDDNHDSDNG